jgi:predicted ester cyclase
MQNFFEASNKGKAAAMNQIDEDFDTDYVVHGGTGVEMLGINDFKQYWGSLYDAMPDIHFTLDDMIAEEDKDAIRYTITGTQKGEFMGIPPTNKKVTVSVVQINRVANGKFAETWSRFNTLGIMQQLGVVPSPGK